MTNARQASQISISNRFYSSRPAVGKQICVSVAGVSVFHAHIQRMFFFFLLGYKVYMCVCVISH